MSQQEWKWKYRVDEGSAGWAGPSEPESHIEHQAALDATVFRGARDSDELVLELDSGELRLRGSRQG